MAAGFCGSEEVVLLHCREGRGDLDDVELCPGVDLRIDFTDVIEDIEHKSSPSGAHLIDQKVVVGIRGQAVIVDEVAGDGFAVVWAEELCRGMPELAGLVFGALLFVKLVFEGGVAATQFSLEFDLVTDRGKVEGLAR